MAQTSEIYMDHTNHGHYPFPRVSKSCNHAITQLRKMSENLRKSLAKERKTGKTGINFMFLSQFDKVFPGL